MSAGKTDCPAVASCPLRAWLALCPWPCSSLSDDTGPAGASAQLRGTDCGAMSEAAGAVAEGGGEGHGAQWKLTEVPLPPLLLNLQLYLKSAISQEEKMKRTWCPGYCVLPRGPCMNPSTLAHGHDFPSSGGHSD